MLNNFYSPGSHLKKNYKPCLYIFWQHNIPSAPPFTSHPLLFQAPRDEGSLPLDVLGGPVSLLRLHPHPGQPRERSDAGGKLQLQLSAHHAEQGVPQEGAVQQRREVPFDPGEPGSGRGLHLREAHQPLVVYTSSLGPERGSPLTALLSGEHVETSPPPFPGDHFISAWL